MKDYYTFCRITIIMQDYSPHLQQRNKFIYLNQAIRRVSMHYAIFVTNIFPFVKARCIEN